MSLHPGRQIGPYIMQELLAEGGMGMVWSAWDTARNEPVAIKAVAHDLLLDPQFKLRIQDEARRHQRLTHPNIVQVLDVFEAENATCIAMQLIEGTPLSRLLESRATKSLDVDTAISLIKDVLQALDYAHMHGVVHRDVKPSNVLVDRHNRALLIDFGIALAAGEERRTRAGQIIGTPEYMSPEQITHPRNIDHRSDVYSVGCVLYEMLTGRPPFVKGLGGVGDTDFAIQQAHVNKTPANPQYLVPTIPADIDHLIMTALSKDPDERIPGCREFLRLLEPGAAWPSRESSLTQRRGKPARWFGVWLGLIGLLILLSLGVLLFL